MCQLVPRSLALYVISVRRTRDLLTASFRFHLTMDTLAVQLCTSSLPTRTRDFHPLERAHGAQTQNPKVFIIDFRVSIKKSDRRGSNPRSRPWQGRALPTTPLSHISKVACATAIVMLYQSEKSVNRKTNFLCKEKCPDTGDYTLVPRHNFYYISSQT